MTRPEFTLNYPTSIILVKTCLAHPRGREHLYQALLDRPLRELLHFRCWKDDQKAKEAYFVARKGLNVLQAPPLHGSIHAELVEAGIRTRAFDPEAYEVMPEPEFWALVEARGKQKGLGPARTFLLITSADVDPNRDPPLPYLVRKPALEGAIHALWLNVLK